LTSWPQRIRRSISAIEVVLKNAHAGDGHIDHVLKVKFHDKTRVLELLAKHLGMLIERREVGTPGSFSKLSDQELAIRIHKASTRLLAQTTAGGESPPSDLPIIDAETTKA
jgi:hypothetical protein